MGKVGIRCRGRIDDGNGKRKKRVAMCEIENAVKEEEPKSHEGKNINGREIRRNLNT